MIPVVQCYNLSLGYEGKTVISHLDLAVPKGDYLCVVGENGAGKSTLLRGILGLIRPISGHVYFHIPLNEVGYLPQQTVTQRDFPASCEEVVLSGFLGKKGLSPFYTKSERLVASSKMDLLDILSLRHESYRNLSGGQHQRVLLARALCATDSLLLMDEPLAGLDPNATNEFYQIINHLNHHEHITVVMVTHDIPGAVAHASHILHLGSVQFYGTAAAYENSPLGRLWIGGGKKQ